MLQELRHDRAGTPLAAPVDARIFEGRAARVHRPGDALRYRWGEEHRDAAELERIRSQIVGKPIAFTHPDSSPENHYGMLSEGAEGRVVGGVVAARVDGDWVVIRFYVDDEEALRAIADGTIELSLGYRCRADAEGYQRDTFVDHVAIVDRGRCGSTCALRADDRRADCACASRDLIRHEVPAEAVAVQACSCKTVANSLDIGHSANHMPNGTDTEAKDKAQMDELQTQLSDANARADQAEKARDAEKARADEAEKARDEAKTRADDAEKALYNAKKDLESRGDAEKKAIAEAVQAEKARADQAEIERDNAQKRAEAAEAEKAEALAAKDREWETKLDSVVTEKVELLALVAPLNLEFKNDEDAPLPIHKVDSKQIKLAAIQHIDAEDLSGKSADWIDCAFYGAMKRHAKSAQSRADAAAAVAEMRDPDAGASKNEPITGYAAEKRSADKLREQLSSQWKTPEKKDQ